MRTGSFGAALCALIAACGDNVRLPPEPGDLVADPAVETGCRPEPVAAGASRAKVVACAEEVPAGLLAAGRAGDVVLENAVVEVVIRARGSGYLFPESGPGGIVDAARVGGQDLVKEILPLAELNQVDATEVVITEAGDDGPAEVVVRGPVKPISLLVAAVGTARQPAIMETHYSLAPDSGELLIRTVLFPEEGTPDLALQIGDIFFFGGRVAMWLPGTGVPAEIRNAEFVASSGTDTSYGVVYPASQATVQFLSIENITGALGPSVAVSGGEPVERYLVIGDGSISSVTDRGWALRQVATATISGTSAPGVEIAVSDAGGAAITRARAGADGTYALSLPPGDYLLRAESAGRDPGTQQPVSLAAGDERTLDLEAGGGGTLELTVADTAGTPLPSRVVARREGERRIHYTGVEGSLSLPLPPGDWTLDVSRGVEYDAFTADPLAIRDGETTAVAATLERVVDTSGWIAIDTHVHSEMSLDSRVPLTDRLASIAAEGVEIALSTDHDFVTDYGPAVAALGLAPWLSYRAGMETTTFAFGHINAWPMIPDYDQAAGGALPWYGLGPDRIFAAMRDRSPGVVIQLNHPRNSSSGYFDLVDFDRDTGAATQDPADLGFPGADLNDFNFDAVEVGNDFNDAEFTESFADYLALVASGHPAAATGSSDSHGKSAFIGNSRTYVFVGAGADDPATVDLDAVDRAIKQRLVTVSQGAFVTAAIEDPATGAPSAFGALVDLSAQTEAILHLEVQAPPWMGLARLVIYAGRDVATTIDLDETDTAAVRFDQTVAIPLAGDGDGFFVVVAEPAGRGDPVLGQPDASFTNPIAFDGDGDGLFAP